MVQFLDTIGLLGIVGLFVGSIALSILVMRLITASGKSHTHHKDDFLLKKYPSVDITRYSGVLTNLGFILSLGLVLAMFEFPVSEQKDLVDLGQLEGRFEEIQDIPPTEQKVPPPPKIKQPELVVVADEIELKIEMEIDMTMEMDEDAVVEEIQIKQTEAAVEEVEEIFQIVEESAEPLGGYEKFYKSIKDNLRYPAEATRLGVQGKVYVQFVVGRNGEVTDLKILRGIGSGCDEEAMRVIKLAGNWKPGKQRGRAVKQYMVIPIVFRLQG